MPTYPANQQPGSLQDLLNMANYQGAPVATPAPPQPSQVFTEGVMTPQERQQLMDKYLAAPDYGPEPTVDKPKLLAQILTGAGDSLTAYASVLGNAPGVKTNALEKYMQYLANQKAAKEKYDARKAEGQAEAQQRKLGYLLGADERARMKQDELIGRKELQANALAAQKDALQARQEAAANTIALQQAEILSREKIAKMETDARLRSDSLQADLHKLKVTGEADKDQHKEYAEMRQRIVAAKPVIEKSIVDGQTTPEQAVQGWNDMLDASDLTGKYRDAANAMWQDKIGTMLMRHAPAQGPSPAPYGYEGVNDPRQQGAVPTVPVPVGTSRFQYRP
jgi:hypothetical protein